MKKLFEKKQVNKSEIDTSYNPYLDAKREWLERYGDYIAQKHNWQILAMLSVFVSLICVLFLGYIGTQNKLVPYIVEVDKLGNTSRVGIVSNTDLKNVNVIKYSINTFITSWRSIWGNIDIQKKFIF
ncbi:conjugal transfer protein TrbF, partial [Campylobacter sp. RM12642]|nr:conjugal transfer protein TrbF [Campylobacter sp. RM12642]